MRLTQIKISGFKSFVDPTKIQFPANLTGIVGPNGCGKSNVIDAVRWVMGESSAKHLRGASMEDVIFSGSATRKPVGQASVELLFDNTQGKAQGEYAKYNEISVKRLVSRDGQSKYFLNNTRCRRRDIADLFLGTGLGPRSYAIIEQGMISRVIDAKPEELRVYFEEAAGISKYKERRRETATRIKHTRENLERLTDVRDEVEKSIRRLDRQAKTADKYKLLKKQLRRIEAELLIMQRAQFSDRYEKIAAVINALEIEMSGAVSHLRNTEANLDSIREQLVVANEQHNVVQGDFYRVGSDIASQEQLLAHQKQQFAKNQQDIKTSQESLNAKRQNLIDDEQLYAELTEKVELLLPKIEIAKQQQSILENDFNLAEEKMHEWQKEWDDANREYNTANHSAQLESKSIEHLDQQVLKIKKRQTQFESELNGLNVNAFINEIEDLNNKVEISEIKVVEQQHQLSEQQASLVSLRESIDTDDAILDKKRTEVQNLRGSLSSLQTLQDSVMNKTSDALDRWVTQQGLEGAKRLTDLIKVENGAEKAVEIVLSHLLGAYYSPSISTHLASIAALKDDGMTLIDGFSSQHTSFSKRDNWVLLSSQIQSDCDMTSLIGLVYLCEDDEIDERRKSLACYESLISKSGIWCGSNWLMKTGQHASDGVISRSKEISRIKIGLNEITQSALAIKSKLDADKSHLTTLEKEVNNTQQAIHQAQKEAAQNQQSLVKIKERQQQIVDRKTRIENDSASLSEEAASVSIDLKASFDKRNELMLLVNDLKDKCELVSQKKDGLQNDLKAARSQQKFNNDELYRLTIQHQAVSSEQRNTQLNIERIKSDEQKIEARLKNAQLQMAEADQPIDDLEKNLQRLLETKEEKSVALKQSQILVSDLDNSQRTQESERVKHNQQIEDIRQKVETEKLQAQEVKVRIETLNEQLSKTDFNVAALESELSEESNIAAHQTTQNDLQRRIDQLGQINLAAIEQFAEESERKKYLDAQNDDLNKSLETLEKAIAKIDRETKDRFKEIFDHVNERMKERFPKLFGGGEAHLELTEPDLLTTGVVIMARPPGKRVNSLQLLSGGEKALTAVALIFAIFELNPSPFCMLDEVDAPLDDANVGRFCAMVKEMSDQVQFIFISHNKITMELAENLNGVTMHEPGISRLVTVNLQDAAELVESNETKH